MKLRLVFTALTILLSPTFGTTSNKSVDADLRPQTFRPRSIQSIVPVEVTSSTDLVTGLVAYWKLDESGGNAIDSCGSNTLSLNNAPGTGTGVINGARTFNGSHQYFTTPTNPFVETGAVDFTFTAWVSMTNKTDYHAFIGKQTEDYPTYIRDYSLYYDKDFDRFIFQVAGPDAINLTRAMADSLGSPAINTWYFLAGGYDYANGKIWIRVNNGVKQFANFIGPVNRGQAPFMLGAVNNPLFGYHAGQLDEVGFWKRTLTDNDLDTLYNSGQGLSYPFNESAACPRVYFPLIYKAPPPAIYGFVRDAGLPASGVVLELRYFNGFSWSTWATATTAADGQYRFQNVPSLLSGELYYVRYSNPSTSTSSRLFTWHTQILSTYFYQSEINIGNFDLADVSLLAPAPGQTIASPYVFKWTKRSATSSDSYQLNVFELDGDPFFQTPLLGYVDGYALGSIPTGFSPNVPYYGDVWAHSPDGGFGVSFYLYDFTFSASALVVQERIQPGDARLEHTEAQLKTFDGRIPLDFP